MYICFNGGVWVNTVNQQVIKAIQNEVSINNEYQQYYQNFEPSSTGHEFEMNK